MKRRKEISMELHLGHNFMPKGSAGMSQPQHDGEGAAAAIWGSVGCH